jgi:hypothetical protein
MDMWQVVGVMWTKTAESTRNHRWGPALAKASGKSVAGRPGGVPFACAGVPE